MTGINFLHSILDKRNAEELLTTGLENGYMYRRPTLHQRADGNEISGIQKSQKMPKPHFKAIG